MSADTTAGLRKLAERLNAIADSIDAGKGTGFYGLESTGAEAIRLLGDMAAADRLARHVTRVDGDPAAIALEMQYEQAGSTTDQAVQAFSDYATMRLNRMAWETVAGHVKATWWADAEVSL